MVLKEHANMTLKPSLLRKEKKRGGNKKLRVGGERKKAQNNI